MTRALPFILSLAAFLLVAPAAQEAEVPDPPEGFSWKQVPAIKAAFLVPEGWHYLEKTQGETLALFISKEPIPEGGKFETGVTVNVFRDNPEAPAQLKEVLERAASRYGTEVSGDAFEPFVRLNTRYDSAREADGELIRTLMIAVINVNTKTSYLILFESPVSSWEQHWPTGEVVVTSLALESEI